MISEIICYLLDGTVQSHVRKSLSLQLHCPVHRRFVGRNEHDKTAARIAMIVYRMPLLVGAELSVRQVPLPCALKPSTPTRPVISSRP